MFFLIAGGCAVGPADQLPATELPSAWHDAPATGTAIRSDRWWTLYGDAMLNPLVDEALTNNHDLAIAAARVNEMRALLHIADAQAAPAIDATFGRNRVRSSEVSSLPLPPGVPLERNTYRGQINVAYEIDLWGRLRNITKAAYADLLATTAARDTIRITLASETVKAYYGLVALDRQVAVARQSLALRHETLRLQRVRATVGLLNDWALRQLEAEVAAVAAQLPALEQRRTAQELALGVLLGRSPRALLESRITPAATRDEPVALVIPQGLPSTLLLRRPDIAEAEQRMLAAHARIGAARAALFPQISLTGFFGSDSAELSKLLSGPARIWQLGFALAQPIFQGDRLFAQIESITARERQALVQYQKTVQNAFREIHEALSAQTRTREIFATESTRTTALTDALRLARIRYESGLTSQLEVLDAERHLLTAELHRTDALRAQRAAVADVVKALGGGWEGSATAASSRHP